MGTHSKVGRRDTFCFGSFEELKDGFSFIGTDKYAKHHYYRVVFSDNSVIAYKNDDIIIDLKGKYYPSMANCHIDGYITFYDINYVIGSQYLIKNEKFEMISHSIAKFLGVDINDPTPIIPINHLVTESNLVLNNLRTCTVSNGVVFKRGLVGYVWDCSRANEKWLGKTIIMFDNHKLIYKNLDKLDIEYDKKYDIELVNRIYRSFSSSDRQAKTDKPFFNLINAY